jgi:hypothetical protein
MMMSASHKAVNPFEDWIFVDSSTWQNEVLTPLKERELILLKRMEAVFPFESRLSERQMATWLIYQGLDTQDYSDMNWNGKGNEELDEKQVDAVMDTFEALYKLCMRDRERLFVLQISMEVLMTFGNIPNLSEWWEKLDHFTGNIDGFMLEDVTFHESLAEALNLHAQYALIDQDVDTAHKNHRYLKKAGYSYQGEKRVPYLEQWSHVSLMLTEIYAHKQNVRNARLLYEDICFVDEELAKGNQEVLEDHAKGAELLIWLSRENPSKPKTLQLQRDLYNLVDSNVENSVMVRHFINGAISMAQSYGNEGQLQPSLRLWQLAHRFVTRGNHYDHPEVLMLLGKLGMNVIWTHTGKESIEDVQLVYDQLCEMAANAKGHPIQFFEQCAWAGVNLAWVYAQKGQLEALPQLLSDIHIFEAHYPMIFGFKEVAAAACRNGLWGMRQAQFLHHDLVFQCIEHEARRLILDGVENRHVQPTSPYFLQQLTTLLYQLGQLDIRLHDYGSFAKRLEWAENLSLFKDTLLPEHALFVCEYALLGIENRNKVELLEHTERYWNVLNTLSLTFTESEDIQRLYAAGACHWAWRLKKVKNTAEIEALLRHLKLVQSKFPSCIEVLRGVCGLHATLSTAYAEADNWTLAGSHATPIKTLFSQSKQDAKILNAWAEVLTKLVTTWPHHRNVQSTLPYLEILLDLSKQYPQHNFWPSTLAQVRAHHCQSFFMLKQYDTAIKELVALQDLWLAFKPHHTVEIAYMNAKAARVMWSSSQGDLTQAQNELWQVFQHHDLQLREKRPLVGWKASLTSALAVFSLAIKDHDTTVADAVFRRSLSLVKQLPQRLAGDPWRSLGYMALGWTNHIPKEEDPRKWFQKVTLQPLHDVVQDLLHIPQTQGIAVWDALRKPSIPYFENEESFTDSSRFIVGFSINDALSKETLDALHQDPDPLWIQQKCFEVCVLEGSQQAESFYQQIRSFQSS